MYVSIRNGDDLGKSIWYVLQEVGKQVILLGFVLYFENGGRKCERLQQKDFYSVVDERREIDLEEWRDWYRFVGSLRFCLLKWSDFFKEVFVGVEYWKKVINLEGSLEVRFV